MKCLDIMTMCWKNFNRSSLFRVFLKHPGSLKFLPFGWLLEAEALGCIVVFYRLYRLFLTTIV